MNGEFSPNDPRGEMEARLTAFLLGELPVHEAAALRQAMDEDTELAALYERLKAASKLVREAAGSLVEETGPAAAPLRLSEERRQKLLAQFKTVTPKEFVPEKRPVRVSRLVEIAAVLAVFAILAGLMLPALSKAKSKAKSFAVMNNLRQIDGAKQEFALENHKGPDYEPTSNEIAPYLGRGGNGLFPGPVAGESYRIGKVGESVTADFKDGRRLDEDGNVSSGKQSQKQLAELYPARKPAPQEHELASTLLETIKLPPPRAARTMGFAPPPNTTIVLPPSETVASSPETSLNRSATPTGNWQTINGSTSPPQVFGNGASLADLEKSASSPTPTRSANDGNGQIPINYAAAQNVGQVLKSLPGASDAQETASELNTLFGNGLVVANGIGGASGSAGVGAVGTGGAVGGRSEPKAGLQYYRDLNANAAAEAKPAASWFDSATGLPVAPSSAYGVAPGAIDPAAGLPVARLSADGSLDTNFTPGNGWDVAPPQVEVKAKFAAITPDDSHGPGFKFELGNTNSIVATGGTAPSLHSQTGTDYVTNHITNPSGRFPVPTISEITINNEGTISAPALIGSPGGPSSQPTTTGQGNFRLTGSTGVTTEREELFAATPEPAGHDKDALKNPEVTTVNGRQGVNGQAAATYEYQQTKEDYAFIDGNRVPITKGAVESATVPTVTGTYFGGIQGQASSQASHRQLGLLTAGGGATGTLAETQAQVPVLGDMPLIGMLGKARANKSQTQLSSTNAYVGGNGAIYQGSVQQVGVNGWQDGATAGPRDGTVYDKGADVDGRSLSGTLRGFYADNYDLAGEKKNDASQKADVNFAPPPPPAQVPSLSGTDSFALGDQKAADKESVESINVRTLNVVGYINIPLSNGFGLAANQNDSTNHAIDVPTDEAASRQAGGIGYYGRFGVRTNFADLGAPKNLGLAYAQTTGGTTVSGTGYVATNGVIASVDPETKRVFFTTNSDASLDSTDEPIRRQASSIDLRDLDRRIKAQEKKVEALRKGLNGAAEVASAGYSLGPVDVLHYNSLKIEAQTQYEKQEKLLSELRKLDKEHLKLAIPASSPDTILDQLLQGQAEEESKLAKLKKELGPNNPEVKREEKLAEENNKQIDSRLNGIMKGLEIQVNAYKARAIVADTMPTTAESGLEPENAANRSKTYQDKKQELTRLMAMRDAMATRSAGRAEASAAPMAEVIERANGKSEQNAGIQKRIAEALTGHVTETARIKFERDVTDVPGIAGKPNTGVYDPYFIQTEFEVLQSEKILDQVIDKLKLNEVWAKKASSGAPLTLPETRQLLKRSLQLTPEANTSIVDIKVKGDEPEEAAKIANTIAEVYANYRKEQRGEILNGAVALQLADEDKKIARAKQELAQLESASQQTDVPVKKPSGPAPVPQPEVSTSENAFSTFSLNIADVSFKLAAATLEKGQMPEAASIRSEEFINAFDYRDPEPGPGAPLAFAWERAQYPFAHNRDLLRFAVQTAAAGREAGRPLNLVLLVDKSGSMERSDRVRIMHEALRVLASQLGPQDKLSVVTFARVARLWVDGLSGSQAGEVAEGLDKLTPEGGTNLEEAMRLAYETARRHYLAGGINRVVLLTDGAANLGNVDPDALKVKAEAHRQEGIALDCFGVGWEGYNDDLLEVLSRNGGGRYGFLNTPEEAANGFAKQLAGALNVAAYDVKVQVEFNPARVTAYRQIGYAKHQLTKEQFRDNTVKAAQVGAAEAGNGLYVIEVNPNGEGPVATVRVRYRVPGTEEYPEHEWTVPYTGNASPLEQASAAMRLAGAASAFSEWLAASPYAGEVTADGLLGLMRGVPETYGADERPKKLEWMIRQAKSLTGK